jgi:hypothetical protein
VISQVNPPFLSQFVNTVYMYASRLSSSCVYMRLRCSAGSHSRFLMLCTHPLFNRTQLRRRFIAMIRYNHRGRKPHLLVSAFILAICYLYYDFWLSIHQISYFTISFYDQTFVRIMLALYLHFERPYKEGEQEHEYYA